MKTSTNFSLEVRERAVRMVGEHRGEHESLLDNRSLSSPQALVMSRRATPRRERETASPLPLSVACGSCL